MCKLVLALAFMLCLGYTARAQNTPEWQIYAGGSFSHAEVSPPLPNIRSLNGWGYNVGVEQYLNTWIGGVMEFSDYYRRPTIDMGPFGLPGIKEQVRSHFLHVLIGPQVCHNIGNFTAFGRATLGWSRRIFNDQNGFIKSDEDAFAFGTGGGVDYRLREHISIRPIEGDYILTHFGGDRQNEWKVSTGVVFSWGQK
jgi:opacity protein-like surface antigen